jgi:hypothetical protein
MYTAMRIATPCCGCASIQQSGASNFPRDSLSSSFFISNFLNKATSAALLLMDEDVSQHQQIRDQLQHSDVSILMY